MKRILRNSPEAQKYLTKLCNPYAAEQIFGEGRDLARDELATGAPTPGKAGKLSKAEFRAACRAIFGHYIPAIEKGRLRTHHREFITRNESSSGETRFRLCSELKRYDLSSITGIHSHFNRERDALTDAKLREIERIVGRES
jgi:hypothetical protein